MKRMKRIKHLFVYSISSNYHYKDVGEGWLGDKGGEVVGLNAPFLNATCFIKLPHSVISSIDSAPKTYSTPDSGQITDREGWSYFPFGKKSTKQPLNEKVPLGGAPLNKS